MPLCSSNKSLSLNLPYQTLGSERNKHRGEEQGGNPKGQKINIQPRISILQNEGNVLTRAHVAKKCNSDFNLQAVHEDQKDTQAGSRPIPHDPL